MKKHCLYFGCLFATMTITCYWLAIGLRSWPYLLVALGLSIFTFTLFIQYRKDVKE
jgi:hypothetical protein